MLHEKLKSNNRNESKCKGKKNAEFNNNFKEINDLGELQHLDNLRNVRCHTCG